ncbi:hypothetical protein pb186bvf_016060 [Paramecium bursaria]
MNQFTIITFLKFKEYINYFMNIKSFRVFKSDSNWNLKQQSLPIQTDRNQKVNDYQFIPIDNIDLKQLIY